VVKQ
jgi:hypothetical protein